MGFRCFHRWSFPSGCLMVTIASSVSFNDRMTASLSILPTRGGWANTGVGVVRYLFSTKLNPFWTTHKEVKQRSNPVRENDDQNPDDFIVSFRWFFGGTIDNH